MKKLALLSAAVFMMASCSNKQTEKEPQNQPQNEEVMMGGEKDEHGCLPSAGETWSELRQTCLQIFNEGIRLNPTQVKSGDAVISAFALFNEDKSKVEIFLPSEFEKHNVILSKTAENTYEAEKLKYDSQKGELHIEGTVRYKAE